MLVQHQEAPFFVRKQIAEKAKAYWKELKDVNLAAVIGATAPKQNLLQHRFEQLVENKLGWMKGEQYEDQNLKITFNTFLLQDDARLEDPDEKKSESQPKKEDIPEAKEEE